ncbi:MAG: Wzz/FepE/Etk N-terminal domain-containing protein [Geminicoccaceae bacterium]
MKPTSGAKERTLFGEDDTIDLLGIYNMLLRRKWLILTVALIGAALAAGVGKLITPQYTAKSQIMLDPRKLQVTNIEQVLGGLSVDSAAIATTIGLLQSHDFVMKLMTDLHLFDDPEFNTTLVDPNATQIALPSFAQPVVDFVASLPSEVMIATGLASQPEPVLESAAPAIVREKSIGRFNKSVTYTAESGSYLISINFGSEDPDKAAVIANRIASLFVEQQLKDKQQATTQASGWLNDRIAELREEVRKSDEAVAQFKADNNIIDAAGGSINDTQLADVNRELITARADLAERQAKLRLVRDLKNNPDQLESVSEVASSPIIVQLRAQQTELLRQESELRTLYGDRHPRMVQLADEKGKVAGQIKAAVESIARQLDNDVRVGQTRVASVESQLKAMTSRTVVDRGAEVHQRELERIASTNTTLYQQFLQRAKETTEAAGIAEPDARVVTVAAPPVSPSTPGAKLLAAGGFTVSFLLGSMIALLLERLDSGLRSAKEVEETLSLATLGLVPRIERLRRNQRPHQYLREKPLSSYAEAIRGAHTALKLSNPSDPPKVVLVTSSLPEEGKTTFAVSLATLVARSQKRVLLLDLDLRHPSVHRELGWQVSGGIVEYMAGERTLQEVIHNDSESGLHFLPVKAQTTTPTDLLESERMRELVQLCRENYDLVVIDSAPVASVNDTRLAAQLADRVVFVVQWGKTVESAARDSLRSLRDAGIEPAGAVLTQIDLRKHARYGYGDIGQYYTRSRRYYVN